MPAAGKCFALLVLVGVLVGSSTALADPPAREPLVVEDFSVPAGAVCSFEVGFEFVSNKQTVTFFGDGRIFITGQFKVRITNLDSGKAITVNAPAPYMIDSSGSEVVVGRGIGLLFAGFDVGGPALVLASGRVVLTRAPDGSLSNVEIHGHVTDLCAVLA